MGLKVEVPENRKKLQKSIEALEWQLTQDEREEDRAIHQEALEQMKKKQKEVAD